MSGPQMTLLITLTGRDRPGITSRLFTVLSAHGTTVLDVEQVVIRGRLVLGVLLAAAGSPDLTAIHQDVISLATDMGMEAEITLGSGEPSARMRGRLHVTVLGRPCCPRRSRPSRAGSPRTAPTSTASAGWRTGR